MNVTKEMFLVDSVEHNEEDYHNKSESMHLSHLHDIISSEHLLTQSTKRSFEQTTLESGKRVRQESSDFQNQHVPPLILAHIVNASEELDSDDGW